MSTKQLSENGHGGLTERALSALSRRKFLSYVGMGSALVVGASALASCDKDDAAPNNNGVNLGSGDVGILNYAYALEQLEAAFYTKVIMSPFSGMTATETALLTDIRDHEIAHRNFFKAAIAGAGATPLQDLEVDFSAIDFGNRNSVLSTAKTFEDLGVSAYNGAGKLIVKPEYLVIAGQIVSVEARHAALIADLISNGSFADSTDANGLDKAMSPAQVLAAADPFIVTKINASNLPTS
ncbi:MAG: ferritin-like domain-containing protein [Sphingobacteriales bacterium]|nr:MAG: ferritin-like domain-containing protein [Sphingobacteriales bacterium]